MFDYKLKRVPSSFSSSFVTLIFPFASFSSVMEIFLV